jgi:hypothetical protein
MVVISLTIFDQTQLNFFACITYAVVAPKARRAVAAALKCTILKGSKRLFGPSRCGKSMAAIWNFEKNVPSTKAGKRPDVHDVFFSTSRDFKIIQDACCREKIPRVSTNYFRSKSTRRIGQLKSMKECIRQEAVQEVSYIL